VTTDSLVHLIEELHLRLATAGIPHAFGGALALAFAVATPRGTADIDVNLFVVPAAASSVFEALPEDVEWSAADVERVQRDGQVRVFWRGTPLDLFFSTTAFHDRAGKQVRKVAFAGGTIPVLDPDDLAVFKAFFDRRKDWADLEAMAEIGSFDADVVLQWLCRLVGDTDERVSRLRGLVAEVGGRPGED
jgi:hypothetical protein